MKSVKFIEKYSWILGVSVILVIIIFYIKKKVEFELNSVETYGKVYDVGHLRVVNFSKNQYKYKFSINGDEFLGTSTKTFDGKDIIGRIFTVKYLPNNPNENEIYFDQELIQKYDTNKERQEDYLIEKK